MINEFVEWKAVDITTVFDIAKYIPDAVKKVNTNYIDSVTIKCK